MNSGIHHTAVLQSSLHTSTNCYGSNMLGSRVVAPCFCCRSPCSMQKSGVRSGPTGAETTDTGTRNKMREETPGPKTSTPVRSPPPAHNNHLFINTWPAMRAHPSWQRPPLGCHIFFSLFLLSTHADFYMLQLTSPLPGGISHRSTNNYRN